MQHSYGRVPALTNNHNKRVWLKRIIDIIRAKNSWLFLSPTSGIPSLLKLGIDLLLNFLKVTQKRLFLSKYFANIYFLYILIS